MAFNGNFCIEDDSDEIDAAAVAGLRQVTLHKNMFSNL